MKFTLKRTIAIAAILALLPCYVNAGEFCFEEAGRLYNISPFLLWSITKVESNFQPNAINWNRNGTYDYGAMQINSSWYATLGHERWNMLGDPCMNVKVGAWILAQCIVRHGYNWQAVGCYNSAKKENRDRYARKVHAVITRYGKTAKDPKKKSEIIARESAIPTDEPGSL